MDVRTVADQVLERVDTQGVQHVDHLVGRQRAHEHPHDGLGGAEVLHRLLRATGAQEQVRVSLDAVPGEEGSDQGGSDPDGQGGTQGGDVLEHAGGEKRREQTEPGRVQQHAGQAGTGETDGEQQRQVAQNQQPAGGVASAEGPPGRVDQPEDRQRRDDGGLRGQADQPVGRADAVADERVGLDDGVARRIVARHAKRGEEVEPEVRLRGDQGGVGAARHEPDRTKTGEQHQRRHQDRRDAQGDEGRAARARTGGAITGPAERPAQERERDQGDRNGAERGIGPEAEPRENSPADVVTRPAGLQRLQEEADGHDGEQRRQDGALADPAVQQMPRRDGEERRRQQRHRPAEAIAREQVQEEQRQRAGGDRHAAQREDRVNQLVAEQLRRQPEDGRHGAQKVELDAGAPIGIGRQVVEHRLAVQPALGQGGERFARRDVPDFERVDGLVVVQPPGDQIDAVEPQVQTAQQENRQNRGLDAARQAAGRCPRTGRRFRPGVRNVPAPGQEVNQQRHGEAEERRTRPQAEIETALRRQNRLSGQRQGAGQRNADMAQETADSGPRRFAFSPAAHPIPPGHPRRPLIDVAEGS